MTTVQASDKVTDPKRNVNPGPAPGVEPLTICSVAYNSKHILEVNHELTRRLNPASHIEKWVVLENSPADADNRLDASDSRFEVCPGLPVPVQKKGRGSHHHGAGLNEAMKRVSSRFVLVLDPDFFLVEEDWIRKLVSHMLQWNLAFMGAPWHPKWYRKWRYFPCAHCLFIDMDKVERDWIDFTPTISHQSYPYASLFLCEHEWMCVRGQRLEAWLRVLRNPRITLGEDLRRRTIIGTSRDTGCRIYERYGHDPSIRHEVFTPVYRPHEDSLVPPPGVRIDGRSTLREWLEYVRPDWLSFIPKRWGYFKKKGFRYFGLPDFRARGWEEFLWKGRPLGVHVRKSLNGDEGLHSIDEIRKIAAVRTS